MTSEVRPAARVRQAPDLRLPDRIRPVSETQLPAKVGPVSGTQLPAKVRLVDYLAGALAGDGVRHVFGVGGANIEDLYDALHATDGVIRAVVAKHEFSAATMADGHARATGRIGVVAATSGGGAVNLLPGLAESYASRVPVLALVGQPPTGSAGRGAFQDSSGKGGSLDAQRLFAPVSRFCAVVQDPDSLPELLAQALAAARTEPPGPAVLLLPKDVQQALIDPPRPTPPTAPAEPPIRLPHRAVELLRSARTVLVIAGEGVASSDARAELAEVAGRLGAWVAVTPDAKDVFHNDDPRFAGVAGVMGHQNVTDCLRRADLCLLVGTRLPDLARAGLDAALAGTPVICIDPEPPFVPGIALPDGVRDTLRAVAELLGPHPRPAPEHAGPAPRPTPRTGHGTTSYAAAVAAVEAALPPDAHVFVDAGNAGASAIHLLPAPRHGRFVVAVGMGGMGYTFGAGIGAALATGRRTYVIAGDGAFFMHGMEVHTAVEYAAPVTFVIFNNNAHAMCATREHLYLGAPHPSNLFRPADIAAGVAAMFPALEVTRADDGAQLHRALLRSNTTGGPAFVALDFDPAETPPFLPFLSFLSVPSTIGTGPRPAQTEETTHDHGPVRVG
ncbi:thiamine pyrophosphate-binding protein [Kitasatospora sp. MAP5-34]|uniref:thiamine pyrophosphate-binding protein n=1 Tax=Kitasatospora sp. MAP5-34 TaxID=3035102 RepID=UPI0024737359|nr:thiamine pyrophosphate-binding protein [Kitasatospora sp. MAP5-34]MDH6577286.1 acetolactate synthase-1/2/3 large subunit [Kitasatospora sp. MAP5-34]